MASVSSLSPELLAELARQIADFGIAGTGSFAEDGIFPTAIPDPLLPLVGKPLPSQPLAVVVDVYGTLLASFAGEPGPAAEWVLGGDSATFPHDMAARLQSIVEADHAQARARGIPWPEVDGPSVFARALGFDLENGARACVAWECSVNKCRAMPGAADFLAACRDRAAPLGIVSNAQFYTPMFVEAAFGAPLGTELGVSPPVGTELGASELGASSGTELESGLGFEDELVLWSFRTGRAKPDRWMFDELAARLERRGIPRGRILYIGNDALNDCATAGEAGLMTALFAGDSRSFKPRLDEPRVAAWPPTTVAVSWADLRRIVCT
jgi:putative hydrolase of the HAD superfamily